MEFYASVDYRNAIASLLTVVPQRNVEFGTDNQITLLQIGVGRDWH